MYDRILVPTDGSEAVDGAIDRAIDLATQYGATLHAVAVVEPIYTVNEGLGSIYDTLESDARASVDEVAERGEAADVTVVTALRTGVTHREILDYAEEEDVDLIVMGTHGRTGLDRYLLGSVTEKVVRLSDVPVLTVRQREDGAAGGDE
ncbi:universal stress protein [Halobaculum lipolyticum]|uniref:Universal stress protein n=1 Tax=Halobaculum lipolyticum TaxID=3032001 RepID=A0ABD5WG78_9EURY|nr:universal stress protein [Halobaculum sp. DT31]